ncbi:MAG: murein L,D-transpeptidase family protein [Hyphomicrobiales bacterium]
MIHAGISNMRNSLMRKGLRAGVLAAGVVAGLALAGCNTDSYAPKHLRPVSAETQARMDKLGMRKFDPILVRIFKKESELEVWKKTKEGRFAHLKTYKICAWSGDLGPKVKEGDRQAPEGFYVITPGQMNPKSNYHLAFNLGFPNAFDRSYGRTGKFLMVHGACSSAGCYAMNDEQIQDIYAVARDAFDGGQREFQVHAFPFHMTPENIAAYRTNPNMTFWKNLKEGYDHFEVTKQVPTVNVCDRHYVFNAELPAGVSRFDPSGKCPQFTVPETIAMAVASKQQKDDAEVRTIVAKLEKREQREAEGSMLANVFGGKPNAGAPADAAPAEGTAIAAVPTPAPAPGAAVAYTGSVGTAASPSEEAGKSVFSRLFSDKDAKPVEPAPAAAPLAEAPAAGVSAADVPAGGQATASVAPDGTPVPVPNPQTAAVAEPEKKSSTGVVGRIGGVFSRLTGGESKAETAAPAEEVAADAAGTAPAGADVPLPEPAPAKAQ